MSVCGEVQYRWWSEGNNDVMCVVFSSSVEVERQEVLVGLGLCG